MINDGLIVDGHPWTTFTGLDEAHLADIRRAAAREGRFVNSSILHSRSDDVAGVGRRWAHAVLGRPYRGQRTDTWEAFLTLVLAMDAEPDPPVDPVAVAQLAAMRAEHESREQAAREYTAARQAAWDSIRRELPVETVSLYNYSGRYHVESYNSGAVHIVTLSELHHGRLHRSAHRALCLPAKGRRHEFVGSSREDDYRRCPTCRSCIRAAAKLAGTEAARSAAELLIASSRRSHQT